MKKISLVIFNLVLPTLVSASSPSQENKPDKLELLNQASEIKPIQAVIAGYLGWFKEHKKLEMGEGVKEVAYSPNGNHIAFLCGTGLYRSGKICIWDAEKLTPVKIIGSSAPIKTVSGLDYYPDCHNSGPLIYSSDSSYLFYVNKRNIIRRKAEAYFDVGLKMDMGPYSSTEFSADFDEPNQPYCLTSQANIVYLFKTRTWVNDAYLVIDAYRSGYARSRYDFNCPDTGELTALSPNGKYPVVGYSTGIVSTVGYIPNRTKICEGPILKLTYSPDGTYVACSSKEGKFSLFDGKTKYIQKLQLLDGNKIEIVLWSKEMPEQVNGITFSPDSKYLAVGVYDGSIRLIDLETTEFVDVLDNYNGISSIAFSPDGTKIIAGNRDNGVSIWQRY